MDASPKKTSPKPKEMKIVGMAHASVSEMVRDAGDAEFADTFDQYSADRRLVSALTALRCARGVSQTDLAQRMGCTQSKVSKIESSTDAELNFGDFLSYSRALGQSVRIAVASGGSTGADRVRYHASSLKHELNRLITMAGTDVSIGQGVEMFALEMADTLIHAIEQSLDKLPLRQPAPPSPLEVEVEDESGGRLPIGPPRRVRKARGRKPSPAG